MGFKQTRLIISIIVAIVVFFIVGHIAFENGAGDGGAFAFKGSRLGTIPCPIKMPKIKIDFHANLRYNKQAKQVGNNETEYTYGEIDGNNR